MYVSVINNLNRFYTLLINTCANVYNNIKISMNVFINNTDYVYCNHDFMTHCLSETIPCTIYKDVFMFLLEHNQPSNPEETVYNIKCTNIR